MKSSKVPPLRLQRVVHDEQDHGEEGPILLPVEVVLSGIGPEPEPVLG